MRWMMASLICATMMAGPSVAQGQSDSPIHLWSGSCGAGSYTVKGGARTPYPCNALIHVTFEGQPGHEQLIFVIKGDQGKQNGVMIGLGGMIDARGDLRVTNLQLTPGEGIDTAPGSVCAITRDGDAFKRIQCNVTADDASGRSVAIDFTATGRVQL